MKLHSLCILLVASICAGSMASAQSLADSAAIAHVDSARIHFKVSKYDLDLGLADNAAQLDSIDRRLASLFGDTIYTLRHVSIVGGASPEGSVAINERLSEQRAATLLDRLSGYRQLADVQKDYKYLGRDWEGVLSLVRLDANVPYRQETLALLNDIATEKRMTGKEPAHSLQRIKALRGGVPYRYLLERIFPEVRASKVVVYYDKILLPALSVPEPQLVDSILIDPEIVLPDTVPVECVRPCKPLYMDVRTNMLYDALALPNIGAEVYVGKNFSVGANWLYGWWKTDRRHRYWRAYGGELYGRWWFGSAAERKPLTGHHLGAYAQFYTYDFEWGGQGEMGGKPGGTLWDRGLWAVGLEYGYSLPVARRLNIDFSLGLGYTQGHYLKYEPEGNSYVWQSTHRRRYFGPTKLEVGLVWLIGCGNFNSPKPSR